MQLVFCMREAFGTAHARMMEDGVPVDDSADVKPYLVNGGAEWRRVQSGELEICTHRGSVVDIDDSFDDRDFTVRDDSGRDREFVLHRSAGKVAVGDEALVRYVQMPSSRTRADGSLQWITRIVEIWKMAEGGVDASCTSPASDGSASQGQVIYSVVMTEDGGQVMSTRVMAVCTPTLIVDDPMPACRGRRVLLPSKVGHSSGSSHTRVLIDAVTRGSRPPRLG